MYLWLTRTCKVKRQDSQSRQSRAEKIIIQYREHILAIAAYWNETFFSPCNSRLYIYIYNQTHHTG